MESLQDKIRRVTSESVEIVDYDAEWPVSFEREKRHLLACFPEGSIVRIEHIGSTAVPGLAAKPIVDILVGVDDLSLIRARVAHVLEAQGYDYFWRPTHGDDGPPFYAWFIKRGTVGQRTHHIHVVGMGSAFTEHWDRLLFRDHLIAHPDTADEYATLKRRLACGFPHDRVRYSEGKSAFVAEVMRMAQEERGRTQSADAGDAGL